MTAAYPDEEDVLRIKDETSNKEFGTCKDGVMNMMALIHSALVLGATFLLSLGQERIGIK